MRSKAVSPARRRWLSPDIVWVVYSTQALRGSPTLIQSETGRTPGGYFGSTEPSQFFESGRHAGRRRHDSFVVHTNSRGERPHLARTRRNRTSRHRSGLDRLEAE